MKISQEQMREDSYYLYRHVFSVENITFEVTKSLLLFLFIIFPSVGYTSCKISGNAELQT